MCKVTLLWTHTVGKLKLYNKCKFTGNGLFIYESTQKLFIHQKKYKKIVKHDETIFCPTQSNANS